MIYALINNGIVNMIVINSDKNLEKLRAQGLEIIDVSGIISKPSTGWTYDGESFHSPVITKSVLSIISDKTKIKANGIDKSIISVILTVDGVISDQADGIEYSIPVLNVAGTPYELLSVTLLQGVSTVDFTSTEKGIYTIDTNLIEPKPTAEFEEIPKIIAN